MPSQTTIRINSDDLIDVREALEAILIATREFMQTNETESPRDFALEKIESLFEEAKAENFYQASIAFKRIISALSEPDLLGNFDYKIFNKEEDNIFEIMSDIVEGVNYEFENLFSSEKLTYSWIKAELSEIYAEDKDNLFDISLYMLDLALFGNQPQHFTTMLVEEGIGTENSNFSEDDMLNLYLTIIDDKDIDSFKILYNNPHFQNLFQDEAEEIIFRCLISDSDDILAFIMGENGSLYRSYDAEDFSEIMMESDSIYGLCKLFNSHEVKAINERYQISEFLSKDDMDDKSIEAIKEQIFAVEKAAMVAEGEEYQKFQIHKNLLDINDLAIFAARNNSKEILDMLLYHDDLDLSESNIEILAKWASWDNAPDSLEMMFEIMGSQCNKSLEGKIPYILTLASTAIEQHSDSALSVILNHMDIDHESCYGQESPAMAGLVFLALAHDSKKCLKLLFEKNQGEEIIDTNMKHEKEDELSDSGLDDSSMHSSNSSSSLVFSDIEDSIVGDTPPMIDCY